jgi:hypothetical protein
MKKIQYVFLKLGIGSKDFKDLYLKRLSFNEKYEQQSRPK